MEERELTKNKEVQRKRWNKPELTVLNVEYTGTGLAISGEGGALTKRTVAS